MWRRVSLLILNSVLISLSSQLVLVWCRVLVSIPTNICVTPSKVWELVASGWRRPGGCGQDSFLVSRGGRRTLLFSRVLEQGNSSYTSSLLCYCLFHTIRTGKLDGRMCLHLLLHVTFKRQKEMWRFSPDMFLVDIQKYKGCFGALT